MKRRMDPVSCFVVGALSLFALAIVGVVVVAIVLIGRARSVSASPPADTGQQAPFLPVLACKGPLSPEGKLIERVRFADPRRVDVAEAFPIAQQLALRLSPDAALFGISANQPSAAGKYDLTSSTLFLDFEHRCSEPGSDPIAGRIRVIVREDSIEAERLPISDNRGMAATMEPLFAPPCPSSAAFALAIRSGVAADAPMQLSYTQGTGHFRGRAVWLLDLDGMDTHKREVDGKTCSLVAMGGSLVLVPPGPAIVVPPPATTGTAPPSTGAPEQPAPPKDPRAPATIERPIEGDLRRADAAELLPAAQALAEELRPGAQLVGIVASRLEEGTADLRPNNLMEGVEVAYQFEHRATDASPTPRGDDLEGSILVTARRGKWTARWSVGTAWKLHEADFEAGPLAPPSCSSSRAWKSTGLPPDRTFTFRYHNERAHHPRTPHVWKIERGQDLLVVDGKTCVLLRDWK